MSFNLKDIKMAEAKRYHQLLERKSVLGIGRMYSNEIIELEELHQKSLAHEFGTAHSEEDLERLVRQREEGVKKRLKAGQEPFTEKVFPNCWYWDQELKEYRWTSQARPENAQFGFSFKPALVAKILQEERLREYQENLQRRL